MVGIGGIMLAIVVVGQIMRRNERRYRSRWFLLLCQAAAPLGFIAVIAGWVTTEVGRQPWTVYGLLRTEIPSRLRSPETTSPSRSPSTSSYTSSCFRPASPSCRTLSAPVFTRLRMSPR
jgi:hypothetical protein